MRGRAVIAGLLLAAACAGPAEAKHKSISASFRIPTVAGQQVNVAAEDGRAAIVASSFDHKAGRYESAFYDSEAIVTRRRVSVDLGAYGSVDMSFRADGDPRGGTLGDCRVREYRGTFTGQASYAGEGTAAAASTTSAGGRVSVVTGNGCYAAADLELVSKRGREATVLEVDQRSWTGERVFQTLLAVRRKHGPVVFSAQRISQQAAVFVAHITGLEAPRDTFTFNRSLTRATILPPAPLTGTGTFERAGRRGRLTGDLAYGPLETLPLPFADGRVRASLGRGSDVFRAAAALPARAAQLARYAGK